MLHLNGYKIAGPTVLGRATDEDDSALSRAATATSRTSSSGDEPAPRARGASRTTLDACCDRIRAIQRERARSGARRGRAGR